MQVISTRQTIGKVKNKLGSFIRDESKETDPLHFAAYFLAFKTLNKERYSIPMGFSLCFPIISIRKWMF